MLKLKIDGNQLGVEEAEGVDEQLLTGLVTVQHNHALGGGGV
jgi:hypothetical protein